MVCICNAGCLVVAARVTALPLRSGTFKVENSHYRHPRHNSLCADYSAADDCANVASSGYELFNRVCSLTADRRGTRYVGVYSANDLQHMEPNLPHYVLYMELQRLCGKL